jgi:hypothetical protein
MPLEEPLTHRDWIEVWKLINAELWDGFADAEGNEERLLEGAKKYVRPSRHAVDRAFYDIRASLVRRTYWAEHDGCRQEDRRAGTTA